jgi:hypothetical protein
MDSAELEVLLTMLQILREQVQTTCSRRGVPMFLKRPEASSV